MFGNKFLFVVISSLLGFSGALQAKDSFSGYYGGFGFGIQNTKSSWNATGVHTLGGDYDSSSPSKFKATDVIYDGFIGHNWISEKYIYGVEFKVNLGTSVDKVDGIPGCMVNCAGYTRGRELDSSNVKFGSGINLNGKFGAIQSNNLAMYGIGGISYQKITTSATCQLSSPDPMCFSAPGNPYSTYTKSNNVFGLSVGAGLEKLVGPYSIKLEYIHTKFNKVSNQATFDGGSTYSYTVAPKRQALSLGVSYFF